MASEAQSAVHEVMLEIARESFRALCRQLMESAKFYRRRDLAFHLLVFPCARCQGYVDQLRDGLCLTCKTRPWQNGRYRNPEEVQTWKP